MTAYKRIGVTVKSGLDRKNETVERVVQILEDEGAEVFFDPKRSDDIPCTEGLGCYKSDKDIDLLVVIGGDGTILRAVRELSDISVPILSVNRGTVGFLAETNVEEADTLIPSFLSGGGTVEERHVLRVIAKRGDKELFAGLALNEAVIAQGTIARLVNLDAKVNGENLTVYHADGLIISTPTGSTAYNLAAGGPIVHPGLAAMILTPINAHSFSQKPVVIAGSSKVDVTVAKRHTKFDDVEVFLTLDGQVSTLLQSGDIVQTHLLDTPIRFLRRKEDTFFGTLREKLKWGDRVD